MQNIKRNDQRNPSAPLQLRRPACRVVVFRQQQRIKSTGRYWEALLACSLIVKATAASLIFFTSDSATQYLIDSTAEWDGARAGSGAAFGVIATTWLHYWWGFLEGFVGAHLPVAQFRLSNRPLVHHLGISPVPIEREFTPN
jgi:hypothetical protein